MNNLLFKSWFRFISLVLINAFLMLDIAWAGGTELSVINPNEMLSAPVQISKPDFMKMFSILKIKVEIFSSKNGKIPPELAKFAFGEGYARVYDKQTDEHIGFCVDGIVYGRDGTGEFKKNLGIFDSNIQTFIKPEEDHSITIAKINALVREKNNVKAENSAAEKHRTPIFESKRDIVPSVGLLVTLYIGVVVPLVGLGWNIAYGYHSKLFIGAFVYIAGAILIAGIVPTMTIPNLLPWREIGNAFLKLVPGRAQRKTSEEQIDQEVQERLDIINEIIKKSDGRLSPVDISQKDIDTESL